MSQYDAGPADTNQVEAHLYFGLPTVGLLVVGLVGWCVGRRTDSRFVIWLVLGSLALLYTPAWHLPVTRHLPGFGFFTGPGRYGIVTALAAAMVKPSGRESSALKATRVMVTSTSWTG